MQAQMKNMDVQPERDMTVGEPVFAFRSRRKVLETSNAVAMPEGTSQTLAQRLAVVMQDIDEKKAIVGALPFHYDHQPDSLWIADTIIHDPRQFQPDAFSPSSWKVRQAPRAEDYANAVSAALQCLTKDPVDKDELTKIVLARCIEAECDQPIDLKSLFNRLSVDPAVNVFQVALPKQTTSARYMIGATPELLISKDGRKIASHPLAGSARRVSDLAEDAAAASRLSRSEKDRHEHAIVVEYILDILAPYCKMLKRPDGMTLTSTKSMWHLGTRIEGELRDPDIPVPILAAAVHPTPAVCGLPKIQAEETIEKLEPFNRDFFTGAVGWCEANGDGEWYVTLRCAEVMDNTARLYAGAGIVPGSDPWSEVAETGAKMGAMMSALNIPANITMTGGM